MRLSIASALDFEISVATSKLVSPAPDLSVSLTWSSIESSVFVGRTATIPPCAYLEFDSPIDDFVTRRISP